MPERQSHVEITLDPPPDARIEEDLKRDLSGILKNAIESNVYKERRGEPLRFVLEYKDAASVSSYLSVRDISFTYVVK